MKIEVVTHCYRYTSLLKYQLSSLILYPPSNLEVQVTVYYALEDTATLEVLRWFGRQASPKVSWNWVELPIPQLCRRSIGRNVSALTTTAEWVWFCDADYWFTSECWEWFFEEAPQDAALIYPRSVLSHRTHDLGDACILKARGAQGLVQADISEFTPSRMNRAIGGVQIVRGDVCRTTGYLPNHPRAQRPADSGVFEKNVADVWFRKSLGAAGQAVNIPGVYRIRHSQVGRNVPGLVL